MNKENETIHQVDLYYFVQQDSKVEVVPIHLEVNGTLEQFEQAIAECDAEMEKKHGRIVMNWARDENGQ